MFFIFAFLITLSQARLNFNSEACSHYINKLKIHSKNQFGPTLLAFTGDASYAPNQNVVVNLRYSDPLFDDALYWGLTQEDGKSANDTCLDLKLFKFTSIFSNPIQITDLPFTTASNVDNKWRYLSLSINKNEFSKYLIQSNNSNNYIYYGYYAIAYYPAETNQIIYTFYFQFSVTISKSQNELISTTFHPFNQYETFGCTVDTDCPVQPSSQLLWCTDETCSNNTTPNLYLNDQFYIKQIVTPSNLSNYYLTNTIVYYQGVGLNKQTIPVTTDNSKTGQVLILLTADILWTNITIEVISYISTSQKGARFLGEQKDVLTKDRFLMSDVQIYDPVSGSSSIECITKEKGAAYPTCQEECQENYFAREGCPVCYIPEYNSEEGCCEECILGSILLFLFMAVMI